MIRTRFKKVLLVAPDFFPDHLLTGYENVKHISTVSSVFPSLYELNPDMIIFDYDYIAKDMEKILRRININKFYDKLKVCCYKDASDEKTDSLLKMLGVDYLVCKEDLTKTHKRRNVLNNFSTFFDISLLKWVANVSQ